MNKIQMEQQIKLLKKRVIKLEQDAKHREERLVNCFLLVGKFMPAIETLCPDEFNSVMEAIDLEMKDMEKCE